MLTKINNTKTSHLVTVKPFSLIIFFYFTSNYSETGEKLMPFFQKYNLTLERLKGKKNNLFLKNIPFFYKNANFVARSQEPLSQKDCVFISQFLVSQTHVLAFFYNGHFWTSSRLKQIQIFFSDSAKTSPINIFWNSFHQQIF